MIGMPQSEIQPPPLGLVEAWKESFRYWEPRRLAYNGVLLSNVILQLSFHSRLELLTHLEFLLILLLLALAANACYCLAYFLDLALKATPRAESWLQSRSFVLLGGCLVGVMLASSTLREVLRMFSG